MRKLMIMLAMVPWLLTSCYTVTMVAPSKNEGRSFERTNSFFIGGLVKDNRYDLKRECPKGVAKIVDQETFANGCVGCCTLGIYTPRTTTITCAE